jgi:hypothetical protein
MKLTPDQLRTTADAYEAAMAGKPVEWWNEDSKEWITEQVRPEVWSLDWPRRPKPEPTTRPWDKPDDVPLNCWIQGSNPKAATLIVGIDDHGIVVWKSSQEMLKIGWSEIHNYRHSVDRITWKACEVEVSE